MAGTRVLLTGRVITSQCAPVAGAIVDVWQADDAGAYDLKGYRLRSKVAADAQGNYAIETILPGLYPGRTPATIHVKISIPGGATLTTQVYFPNENANKTDGIFDAAMLAMMSRKQQAGQRWRTSTLSSRSNDRSSYPSVRFATAKSPGNAGGCRPPNVLAAYGAEAATSIN